MKQVTRFVRLLARLSAVASIALHLSAQGASADVHSNRLAVRLTDIIAANMQEGVARRVTAEAAARGVTDPYRLGRARALQATVTTCPPQTSGDAQAAEAEPIPPTFAIGNSQCTPPPPTTSIAGNCMLTSSTGSGSCGAMTLPAACATSTNCYTVVQGCTSGSSIQCSTMISSNCTAAGKTDCGYTVAGVGSSNCSNYTQTQNCGNHTFYPACATVVPGQSLCVSTSAVGSPCPTYTSPNASQPCQPWTASNSCGGVTNTNNPMCQAFSSAPGATGCTVTQNGSGNCGMTFSGAANCDIGTYSVNCIATFTKDNCSATGGCLHTYGPACMTYSTGGFCASTSANPNCFTSVSTPGGANSCTSASSTGTNMLCKPQSAMAPSNAAPLSIVTLIACVLPLGSLPILRLKRS